MGQTIEAGSLAPDQIGFVSFTRAARSEAAERASRQFGCTKDDLEQRGWFRTLHSVCYRCLEAGGDLLTDNAASRRWISDAIQESVGVTDDDDGDTLDAFAGTTDAGKALALWHAARNRLEPLAAAWERANRCDDRTPALEWCEQIVSLYETAKRVDGRRDFTDLLAAFAGRRCRPEGAETVTPQGFVPELPVWFFDEQQDTSALLDLVCRRLIETDGCRWVYVVGDPFQAIYGWAGADARCFRAWPVAKERIMPKSFRCPAVVQSLGEELLRPCSDYFDRGIAPADHEGEIDVVRDVRAGLADVDPRESWLLLARSNFHARRIGNLLDRAGIPWLPTRGNGGWNAPVRQSALAALHNLQHGVAIGGDEWRDVLKIMPSKAGGDDLLIRGTKKQFEDHQHAKQFLWVPLAEIDKLGATEKLKETIRSGGWTRLVERADEFCSVVDRWGFEAATNPQVKVGTVHSVKGAEADNVAVLTTTSRQVALARETPDGGDEERRIAYVAVTRARKRLVVINEAGERNTMGIEP